MCFGPGGRPVLCILGKPCRAALASWPAALVQCLLPCQELMCSAGQPFPECPLSQSMYEPYSSAVLRPPASLGY